MLTQRISRLSPSKTMALTAKARKMKEQGIKVLDFSAGEPDFGTPEYICEAAKAALDAGYTKYTPVHGIPELRKAICEKLERENGISYTPEQICVSTGAKQALFNAVFAVCEQGDEVVIPTPSWVSYEEMVKLAGAQPVFVPGCEEEGFHLNLGGIRKAVSPRTKAIILNTPNNPTGVIYTEEELRELGNLAVEHQFFIITDEVYEKLVYGQNRHVSVAALSDEIRRQCILINGFSKAYAMTGWRVGYVAAGDEVSAAVRGIQSHTTSCASSIAQYAALEAYRNDRKDVTDRMLREFGRRHDYLMETIREIPGVSCNHAEGAFYMMLDVRELLKKYPERFPDTDALADALLAKAHIAMVSGSAFHAEGYLRVCYAVSMETIQKALGRLDNFIAGLKS